MLSHRRVYLCLAIAVLVFSFLCWYRSDSLYSQFASGVPDDASYYLKPALNSALGLGSSFDGVNPTNGYQPLWFILLVGFLKLLPLEHMSLLAVWQAAIVLQAALLAAGTAIFFYALLRITQSTMIALLFGLAPIIAMPNRLLNLLETPVQFLVFAIMLLQLYHLLERPAREDFRARLALLGITTGLLFLARTDGLAMAIGLTAPLAIKFVRQRSRLFWYFAPVGAIVLLYWIVNYANFGVLMPVSGSVKLDQTKMLMARYPGWQFVWQKLAFIFGPFGLFKPAIKVLLQAMAWLPALWLIIKQVRGRLLSNRELIALGLGVFLLAKYAAYTLIYHGSRIEAYWYWVIDVVVWCVFGALVLRYLLERFVGESYWRRGRLAAPVLLVLLCGGLFVRTSALRAAQPTKPVRDTSVLLDLASFIGTHDYFKDKRIGAFNAGILGYFSGRQVTNLDGLINAPAFAKLIASGQRDAYIQKNMDVLIEYHGSYVRYYTSLGFSLYNVRQYIVDPVPFNPATGDDYRIYIKQGQEPAFQAFLSTIKK